MATEDLVPRNMPYGNRKAYVENARAAGVPTESRPQVRPTSPSKRGRAAGSLPAEAIGPDLDLTQFMSPEEVPGVDISPEGQMGRLAAEMTRLASSSPNPIVRGVARTWISKYAPQGVAP
jgi:hypothetical protein